MIMHYSENHELLLVHNWCTCYLVVEGRGKNWSLLGASGKLLLVMGHKLWVVSGLLQFALWKGRKTKSLRALRSFSRLSRAFSFASFVNVPAYLDGTRGGRARRPPWGFVASSQRYARPAKRWHICTRFLIWNALPKEMWKYFRWYTR